MTKIKTFYTLLLLPTTLFSSVIQATGESIQEKIEALQQEMIDARKEINDLKTEFRHELESLPQNVLKNAKDYLDYKWDQEKKSRVNGLNEIDKGLKISNVIIFCLLMLFLYLNDVTSECTVFPKDEPGLLKKLFFQKTREPGILKKLFSQKTLEPGILKKLFSKLTHLVKKK